MCKLTIVLALLAIGCSTDSIFTGSFSEAKTPVAWGAVTENGNPAEGALVIYDCGTCGREIGRMVTGSEGLYRIGDTETHNGHHVIASCEFKGYIQIHNMYGFGPTPIEFNFEFFI